MGVHSYRSTMWEPGHQYWIKSSSLTFTSQVGTLLHTDATGAWIHACDPNLPENPMLAVCLSAMTQDGFIRIQYLGRSPVLDPPEELDGKWTYKEHPVTASIYRELAIENSILTVKPYITENSIRAYVSHRFHHLNELCREEKLESIGDTDFVY